MCEIHLILERVAHYRQFLMLVNQISFFLDKAVNFRIGMLKLEWQFSDHVISLVKIIMVQISSTFPINLAYLSLALHIFNVMNDTI